MPAHWDNPTVKIVGPAFAPPCERGVGITKYLYQVRQSKVALTVICRVRACCSRWPMQTPPV